MKIKKRGNVWVAKYQGKTGFGRTIESAMCNCYRLVLTGGGK